VLSPAFQGGGTIPQQFTCDGPNVSPPLDISGVPSGADSLALVMEDRDAPGGRFVHWSLYEISTGQKTIAQGTVPAGASEGQNSFGKTGYGGPCPPKDNPPHRYVIAVYALSASPGLKAGAKPDDVFTAIERTAVSRGLLEATY
jgi:Raf kinase inhibitor-like YbhB/YbcL family protein